MGLDLGILSVAYEALKDALRWITKRWAKPDKSEIIKIRQRWKKEIEENLSWIGDVAGYGEVIIRDVKRVDKYPEVDETEKGISPWFRVGLIGIYHRGLQVGLRIEGLKFEESVGSWRYSDYKSGEESDLNAYVVGRIPFEKIVEIDWDGDEYYRIPHVYCHFDSKRKKPYEEVVFCERHEGSYRPVYEEVCKYDEVRRLSKKMKTGY